MLGVGLVTKSFAGLVFSNNGTVTTIKGIAGDYLRIGDAGTTAHSLNSEDDLMVTGDFEVKANAWVDGSLTVASNVSLGNQLQLSGNGAYLTAKNTAGYYATLCAMDTGVGVVEVARLQGAADPEFQLGNNGNVMVATYAGLCGFFAATPTGQNIHITDAPGDTAANNATTINAILVALETYGLLATS